MKTARKSCPLVVFFLIILGLMPLYAEEVESTVLTVEDAVMYARENSRTLKSAAIDLDMKTRAKNNAWNVFIPSIQASGTLSRSNEYSNMVASIMSAINPLYVAPDEKESDHWKAVGNVSASLNLSLALADGIKATYESYEVGKLTWDQAVKENELNIRKMFYALLLQQESLSLQKDSLKNAEARVNQAKSNFKNGLVPELSLLQAQVTYENQKPTVLKQEQAFEQQLEMFGFLLGMPLNSKIVLSGSIAPTFVELNADELVSKYVQKRLDIEIFNKNLNLLEIQRAAQSKSIYTPAVSFSYGFQPVISDITKDWFKDDNNMDNGSFSMSLVWNLTNMLPFSSSQQSLKDIDDNIRKMKLNQENIVLNAEIEIRNLIDTLNQSSLAIEVSKQSIALAQKSYNMTVIAYNNGTTELLDVRDAETQLNQAKLGLVSEQYTYLSSLLDLEYAINTKLIEQ